MELGIPQGLILGLLFFLSYVNSLSKIKSDRSNPILIADDTSIIITHSNPLAFRSNINFLNAKLNPNCKPQLAEFF